MSKLHINKQYLNPLWTVATVGDEISQGLDLLNTVENTLITFFGSHKVGLDNHWYRHARTVAYELGKRKYAIMSGGGPGIMHAANAGATEAQTISLGLQAELLTNEHIHENIYTKKLSFKFLFVRRFLMAIKSEALLFYPGGYGTLNELFEYAVLMQTGIVDKVPIICVGKDYWNGLFMWLRDHPLKNELLIHNTQDLHLLYIVDSFDEIMNIIEQRV